jgi:hypothetical protein
MDAGVSNGLAAVMGALVGGLASLTSSWVGERTRHSGICYSERSASEKAPIQSSSSTLQNFT